MKTFLIMGLFLLSSSVLAEDNNNFDITNALKIKINVLAKVEILKKELDLASQAGRSLGNVNLDMERAELRIQYEGQRCLKLQNMEQAGVCILKIERDPWNGIESAELVVYIQDNDVQVKIANLQFGMQHE